MSSSDDLSPVRDMEKEVSKSGLNAVEKLLEGQSGQGQIGKKQIGLAFHRLSVAAPNSTVVYAKTLPRAILNTFGIDQFNFVKNLFPKTTTGDTKPILSNFTGIVKPGEMLFVIGRPGSGCSTFLRTAANRSTLEVTGDLSFANIPAAKFGKSHQRETIYLPEEDRHIAALTVSETISFALRMNLPQQLRSKELIGELVTTMAKMFGLEHTINTPVGGAFFPGVSGGERKR